jgi:Flp pilus assembly protein TadD
MMGLGVFLALYCFVRGRHSVHRRAWFNGCLALTLLGLGTKETMAVVPLLVVLYDVTFTRTPLKALFRERGLFYTGLFLTWGVLFMMELHMLAASMRAQTETVSRLPPWRYLASQFGVILHYLRLSVWPYPQCLDYAWPVAEGVWAIAVPAVPVVGLGLVTLWAILRRHPMGMVGGWFWLTLGPSSSVLPIPDLAFEHRMYLPLAAVVVGLVMGGGWGWRFLASLGMTGKTLGVTGKTLGVTSPKLSSRAKRGISARRTDSALLASICVAVICVLAGMTVLRNRDYRAVEVMARDVVRKRPENYRQQVALITALLDRGAIEEAERRARELVARTDERRKAPPRFPVGASDAHYYYAIAQNQLGRVLLCRGRGEEAMRHFRASLAARRYHKVTHYNVAVAHYLDGRLDEALKWCDSAVEIDPGYARAHALAARLLAEQGALDRAAERYRVALDLNPHLVHVTLDLRQLISGTRTPSTYERTD